jgi:hypothetical protein
MDKRVIKYENFPLFCVIFYLRVAKLFIYFFMYFVNFFLQNREIFRKMGSFSELFCNLLI